jgi:hypothetical protein
MDILIFGQAPRLGGLSILLCGTATALSLVGQIIIDAERPTGLFPQAYVVIWPAGLQPR